MEEHEVSPEDLAEPPDTPSHRLEYVERRVDSEMGQLEGDLQTLGRLKEDIVLCRRMERFLREAGVERPSNTIDYTLPLVERTDEVYAPRETTHTADLQVLCSSAAGFYYSGVTGSYAYYEDVETTAEADRLATEYQELQGARNIQGEVIRKLRWVSEVAAGKFEAAWAGFHARVPSADPTSGPALEMRSALTSTVDSLVDRLPPPDDKLNRRRCVEHIAQHAARSPGARAVLEGLAHQYVDLLRGLSAVKDKTDLERKRLRSLMFEATDFLSNLLGAIDYAKLMGTR